MSDPVGSNYQNYTLILSQLQNVDPKTYFIHSDLTCTKITPITFLAWKALSLLPFFGRSLRNYIFDTNPAKIQQTLNNLKNCNKDKNTDTAFIDLFNKAVTKFNEIAPKYQVETYPPSTVLTTPPASSIVHQSSQAPSLLQDPNSMSIRPDISKDLLKKYQSSKLKLIEEIDVKNYLLSKIPAESIQKEQLQQAANSFQLNIGLITRAAGVIQDPAGAAIGQTCAPENSTAEGLSRAIYNKFKNRLQPIPRIESGKSQFNATKDPDAKRILHTHAPHLSSVKNVNDAVDALSDTYYNAIVAFLTNTDHQQNTLNLCAVSAGIYSASFALPFGQATHLDPSITLTSLTIALVHVIHQNNQALNGKTINIFYTENQPLNIRAQAIDRSLKNLGL
jgi:hypothetical protein